MRTKNTTSLIRKILYGVILLLFLNAFEGGNVSSVSAQGQIPDIKKNVPQANCTENYGTIYSVYSKTWDINNDGVGDLWYKVTPLYYAGWEFYPTIRNNTASSQDFIVKVTNDTSSWNFFHYSILYNEGTITVPAGQTVEMPLWAVDINAANTSFTANIELWSDGWLSDCYLGTATPTFYSDDTIPSSQVYQPSGTLNTNSFTVKWNGSDPGSPASGIKEYTIQYNIDGGVWQNLTTTSNTQIVLTNQTYEKTYCFRSQAKDKVDNLESFPSSADTCVTLLSPKRLTVNKSGTGSGTVTSSPSGINCGSTCFYDFAYNTTVILTATATPATGHTFSGWSGGGCSGMGTCTINMISAQSVTANFTAPTCYTLTRSYTGSGSQPTASPTNSTGCPSGQYTAGQSITMTAYPASGYSVGSWSGTTNNASTSTTNYVTMPAGAHTVTANYVSNTSTLPDLIIQSITASPPSPALNQLVTFTVRVQNQGTVDVTTEFWVDFYIDTLPITDCSGMGTYFWKVYSLAAGEVEDLTYTYQGFSTGGAHNLHASSDTNCSITESIESNNILGPIVLNLGSGTTTFGDVPLDHPLYAYIQALYDAGFTAGCSASPLMFCPDTILDRAQSAVFMLRGQLGSGYTPPAAPWNTFLADNWVGFEYAQPWAEGMWQEGLTQGCQTSPLMYCPATQLPRVEASVFGLKMKYGVNYLPPPATGTLFADFPSTDPSYWAIAWAEKAYVDGLLPACGTDSVNGKPMFCPGELVNRAWGAYLIVQAKGLPLP